MNPKSARSSTFEQSLQQILSNQQIYSAVLQVSNTEGSISWKGAGGGMKADSPYMIASVTKLYVTAVVLQLMNENRLRLEDKICDILPEQLWQKIHVYKGVDYSQQITIQHLISNSSGIPDYFFHKQAHGKTVADSLMSGQDEAWPLEKTIGLIKNLKPRFAPGAKGKAAYSDSNYQLLGRILEIITGQPIAEIFQQYIFQPLNLQKTYVYCDPTDMRPVPFFYGSRKLWLPQYLASVGAEGGIVSTAEEVMIFLKAFFNGQFFETQQIESLKQWNLILPPPGLFFFGIGLEKLWTPWIASPFKPIREILGFWGQTGSFAFYNPKSDLYFCGTTNQINGAGHRAAGRAMLKIIKSAL